MANNPVVDVSFKSNAKLVLGDFERQVVAGLMAIGATAEGYAKEDCPVGTPESTGIPGYIGGTLRNSISNAVVDNEVYIGTNVVYAPPQEFNNYKHQIGKAHFLRDAAATHGDEYRQLMEAALKD